MDRVKGQRVLITRAAEDCAAWGSRLANVGAVPLMLPCIECHPIRGQGVEARLSEALPNTDWLVLTSRRGAEALSHLIAPIEWGPADKAAMAAIRIAVVGPATAAAATALPGQVELVAPGGTARSLADALAARLRDRTAGDPRSVRPGSPCQESRVAPRPARRPADKAREGRILDILDRRATSSAGMHRRANAGGLLPRAARCLIVVAENASNILQESLEQAGGDCLRLNVYRTQPAAPATPKQALSELGADKILLASPSAVTGLVNRLELDAAAEILTIGPSTTRAAHAAGLTVTAEAAKPSLEGLMEAMQ